MRVCVCVPACACASAALLEGSAFAAGFLSDLDLQRYYRASVPYISNPYTTMGQTSVNVSRRFVCAIHSRRSGCVCHCS